jgi:CysZ protein
VLSQLLYGAAFVCRGARYLLSHPRLFTWVAIPYAITLALFILGAWAAFAYFDDLVRSVTSLVPSMLAGVLGAVLYLLLASTLGLASYFLFFAIAAIVAGPFNELLAEAVEEQVSGIQSPSLSLGRLARDVMKTIAHETRKVLRYLLFLGLLFLVSVFLPGVGWLAYVLGGAFLTARFAAYDVLDYTMARRGWTFRRKQEFLARHRSVTTGLGTAVAAVALIPLVGPLAYPLGAIGGTLLFLELEPRATCEPPPRRDAERVM